MNEILTLDVEPVLNVRKTTLHGREYVVADVTILKQGVLHGSKGPLFYPLEEIAREPDVWNGIPVTNTHPMKSGKPVSARDPDVWNEYTVGFFFKDTLNTENKSRLGEVWVDVEVANRINPKIIPSILSGKGINVSTGLKTTDEKVTENSKHNGKEYTHIARNYKPDHLAILLDEKGACSIKDGCGINVNTLGVNEMRDQLVTYLTTNCDCWKGKEELLKNEKNFTEDDLKTLKSNAEKSTLAINSLKELGSTLKLPKDGTIDDLKTLAKNAADAKSKAEKDKEDEDKEAEEKKKKMATNSEGKVEKEQVVNVVKDYLSGLSEKERIDLIASPTLNALMTQGQEVINEKRFEIMKALTANILDSKEKEAKLLKLKDKTLPQLREFLEFSIATNKEDQKVDDNEMFLANFFNTGKGKDGKLVPLPKKTEKDQKNFLAPSLSINVNEDEEVVEVA